MGYAMESPFEYPKAYPMGYHAIVPQPISHSTLRDPMGYPMEFPIEYPKAYPMGYHTIVPSANPSHHLARLHEDVTLEEGEVCPPWDIPRD